MHDVFWWAWRGFFLCLVFSPHHSLLRHLLALSNSRELALRNSNTSTHWVLATLDLLVAHNLIAWRNVVSPSVVSHTHYLATLTKRDDSCGLIGLLPCIYATRSDWVMRVVDWGYGTIQIGETGVRTTSSTNSSSLIHQWTMFSKRFYLDKIFTPPTTSAVHFPSTSYFYKTKSRMKSSHNAWEAKKWSQESSPGDQISQRR